MAGPLCSMLQLASIPSPACSPRVSHPNRQQGLPRASYSIAIDGARAGQPSIDEYYAGISSAHNRHADLRSSARSRQPIRCSFTNPAGGSYSFSYIGYNGNHGRRRRHRGQPLGRCLKYRSPMARPISARCISSPMDQPAAYSASSTWTAATCAPEAAQNNAYGFDLGGNAGKFFADIVYQHYNQAISILNPLLGLRVWRRPISRPPTASIQTPSTGQSDWNNQHRIWHRDRQQRSDGHCQVFVGAVQGLCRLRIHLAEQPGEPVGRWRFGSGGYIMSGAKTIILILKSWCRSGWTGAKYTYRKKTDVAFAWYQQRQNDFRIPSTCSTTPVSVICARPARAASTRGRSNLDHHFTKRFDSFAGVAYSFVSGVWTSPFLMGPGVPYKSDNNFAPTVGSRFTF